MSWAEIVKGVNSTAANPDLPVTPINHFIWLNDWLTLGEKSMVENFEPILKELAYSEFAINYKETSERLGAEVITKDWDMNQFYRKLIEQINGINSEESLSFIQLMKNNFYLKFIYENETARINTEKYLYISHDMYSNIFYERLMNNFDVKKFTYRADNQIVNTIKIENSFIFAFDYFGNSIGNNGSLRSINTRRNSNIAPVTYAQEKIGDINTEILYLTTPFFLLEDETFTYSFFNTYTNAHDVTIYYIELEEFL